MSSVRDYFFLIALVGNYAALTSYYGLDAENDILPVVVALLSYSFIYFLTIPGIIQIIAIPIYKNGYIFTVVFCILMVIYLILWYLVTGVATNLNFDLEKVYDFRETNAELADVGFAAYLNSWVQKIFNVFLIAFFLSQRRYGYVLLFVFVQIFFFGVSAHKAVLGMPVLVIGVWYLARSPARTSTFLWLFSVMILLTLFQYMYTNDIFLSSLLIRRLFFVPAFLSNAYMDFFSINEYVTWSNSILKYFLEYPYDLPISYVVGRYLGDSTLGANNGFISSGYAHAGIVGTLIYSFVLAYIIRLLDHIVKTGTPLWLVLALTIIPIYGTITSSDLLTTLLTHGLLVSLLVLLLIRKQK
ncbi:MAG: hypothetical protein ACFCUI_08205 [Bernardetiaceae bacterium]